MSRPARLIPQFQFQIKAQWVFVSEDRPEGDHAGERRRRPGRSGYDRWTTFSGPSAPATQHTMTQLERKRMIVQ